MTTSTLKDIVNRLVQAGATSSPTLLTASSGSTTTFASTTATFDKTSSTAYAGRVLWVTFDAGGANAAPENEARAVTSHAVQTITIPAFSVAPASGDTAVLLPPGWAKDMVLDAINDTIRKAALPRYLPLTLCPDGDMESSGDTNWAAVGSGTGTKASTAADTLLKNHLAIGGTSDGDGQRSDPINVFEGETLFVDVAIRCDTGTAQVELWNADTSAVISGTQYETNEEGFARISFHYAVDTGVERIAVQITQDGATALTAKLGWVSVLSNRRTLYDLPSSVGDTARVESFMYLRRGGQVADDGFFLWERGLEPWQGSFLRDYQAANSQRIQVHTMSYDGPLFMFFRATESALTTMASQTVFPIEPLIQGALAGIYDRIYNRFDDPADKRRAQEHSRAFAAHLRELELVQPIVRTFAQRRIFV